VDDIAKLEANGESSNRGFGPLVAGYRRRRKLAAVELKFGRSDFEKRHYSLLAMMCTYGIELLADNIAECRANMLEILAEYLNIDEADDIYRAASYVLSQNLGPVHK
jgi:hypothetical protein